MRTITLLVTAILALFIAASASAQEGSSDSAGSSQSQLLDEGQLDQLVAPIALYPDALLTQVLMASTYPLEVVQADRFAEANKNSQRPKARGHAGHQGLGGERQITRVYSNSSENDG